MSKSESDPVIKVSKVFKAPVDRVFAHFTQPELLAGWHNPNPDQSPRIDVDLKVGGVYRFEMNAMDGNTHVAVGTYLEIVLNEKLVFSWQWENGTHPETTVTVLFKPVSGQTEIELIHEGFVDEETQGHHNQGWIALLGNLEGVLG